MCARKRKAAFGLEGGAKIYPLYGNLLIIN